MIINPDCYALKPGGGAMAKKGIEKIVQEALLKGYTVNRSEDRFEISKPGKN